MVYVSLMAHRNDLVRDVVLGWYYYAFACSGTGPLLSVYSVCMLCRFCAAAMVPLRGHFCPVRLA